MWGRIAFRAKDDAEVDLRELCEWIFRGCQKEYTYTGLECILVWLAVKLCEANCSITCGSGWRVSAIVSQNNARDLQRLMMDTPRSPRGRNDDASLTTT